MMALQACGKPPGPDPTAITTAATSSTLDFATVSAQVLQPKCLACHSNANASGGINFSTYASTLSSRTVLLANTYKVGASYFYGHNDLANRHVFGPWGILGITSRIFLLTEFDFQRNYAFDFTEPQWGFANYNRLDFEPLQGLHTFGTAEFSKLNFSDPGSRLERYGLGIQFFPRPHFEFEVMGLEQRFVATSSDHFQQTLWLMLHYYL